MSKLVYYEKCKQEGLVILDKSKTGVILGALSLLPVLLSITTFYILRGPDFQPSLGIPIFIISSIFGLILSSISLWLTKPNKFKLLIGSIGVIANIFILVCTFLLLLAIGMSEK